MIEHPLLRFRTGRGSEEKFKACPSPIYFYPHSNSAFVFFRGSFWTFPTAEKLTGNFESKAFSSFCLKKYVGRSMLNLKYNIVLEVEKTRRNRKIWKNVFRKNTGHRGLKICTICHTINIYNFWLIKISLSQKNIPKIKVVPSPPPNKKEQHRLFHGLGSATDEKKTPFVIPIVFSPGSEIAKTVNWRCIFASKIGFFFKNGRET